MSGTDANLLQQRERHTNELLSSPYDASVYLERAICHERLGYFDLAVGDAYKALILTDEALEDSGEYHEQTIEAIRKAVIESGKAKANEATGSNENGHDNARNDSDEDQSRDDDVDAKAEEDPWCNSIVEDNSRRAYEILTRSLFTCGDLKSAWDFAERGCKAFPNNEQLQRLREQPLDAYRKDQSKKGSSWDPTSLNPRTDLPQNGLVRREIYPWNTHEPDRFSPSVLSLLNAELAKVAPKCEVRAVELPLLTPSSSSQPPTKTLKQLGLFATHSISPNEPILTEPSTLTATNLLHDPLCDACSSPLPPPSTTSNPLPTCPTCDDTVFCSPPCLALAQKLYHPAICGHPDFDLSARDPSPPAATSALYLLLLARTIAMAQTQGVHPLELLEVKFLWGGFASSSPPGVPAAIPTSTLPFSFQDTILAPLHLLENIGVNIFEGDAVERYDVWVVNTLMAKFRGVASARMNARTGMPEVAAVHWRWSLANHSCAPGVRWEWPFKEGRRGEEMGGCMGLIARGGEEVVQWGPLLEGKEGRRNEGGIRQGEEILNHYCDVELSVEERREWAAGALGGVCVCERCVWESGEGGGANEGREGKERGDMG